MKISFAFILQTSTISLQGYMDTPQIQFSKILIWIESWDSSKALVFYLTYKFSVPFQDKSSR